MPGSTEMIGGMVAGAAVTGSISTRMTAAGTIRVATAETAGITIGKITGMTTGTIRKWCARYDIRLLAQSDGKKKKPVDDFRLLANKDIFQAKAINIENALSRQWSSCVNKFI